MKAIKSFLNLKSGLQYCLYLFFVLIFLHACGSAPAQYQSEGWGRVVSIIDGDTYDLLLENGKSVRIRMHGIDAPERGMPYNKVSKEYLGKLCANARIRYVREDTDRYGRMVAKGYLEDGRNLEQEMVRAGMAWHYTRYSSDKKLASLEKDAREKRRGLWQDSNPVAPWEYRKMKRSRI